MTSETESSAEISYFWRVTSQSMMVLLIGFRFVSSNQKHYRPLGSDASSVWNFLARFSDFISRGNQCWRREISALFSVYIVSSTTLLKQGWDVRPLRSCLPFWSVGSVVNSYVTFRIFTIFLKLSISLLRFREDYTTWEISAIWLA